MTQTIVLTTGGTGGHIFPAQSVAGELIKKGYQVVFITDKRGNAFQNLPEVQTYRLIADSVTGRSVFGKAVAFAKLILGAVQAMRLLFRLKPVLVIGFGGYASLPTVMSAQMLKIPTLLHEQNAILGRTNRVAAWRVKMIATSFPSVEKVPPKIATIHVGQPVRAQILERQNMPFPTGDVFHLLIFGGSQGAHFFSTDVSQGLMKLPSDYRARIALTQQVRPEDEEEMRKTYENAGFQSVTMAPFFNNMPELLNQTNLVIGRGGAGTLTDVIVVGRPIIVIPLPTAADNHQVANAKQIEAAGGGWVIEQKDFNADQFAERLQFLMDNPDVLKQAAEKAHALAVVNAAEKMAQISDDIVKGVIQ